MEVAAIVGPSGSGKTTLLCELIAQFAAEGRRVAAIKHTHHPLDDRDRGDTALFRRAGAVPVLLAGEGEAIRFEGDATARLRYEQPADLLRDLAADLVLIEGFSQFFGWPRIELDPTRRMSAAAARSILDRIWRHAP